MPSKTEIGAMLSKSVEMWPLTKVQKTRAGTPKVVAQPWANFIVTAIFTGLRTSNSWSPGIMLILRPASFGYGSAQTSAIA